MITPAQGAERHQLPKWSTKRLERYFKSRKKSLIIFSNNFTLCGTSECTCGYRFTENAKHTIAAMEAELEFIRKILFDRTDYIPRLNGLSLNQYKKNLGLA